MRVSCRVILNNSYLSLLAGVQAFVSETVIYIRISLIRSVLDIVYVYARGDNRNEKKKKGKLSSPWKIIISSFKDFFLVSYIKVDIDRCKARCLLDDWGRGDTGSRNRWISTRFQLSAGVATPFYDAGRMVFCLHGSLKFS